MDNGNSTKENGDVRGSHVLVPSAITWGGASGDLFWLICPEPQIIIGFAYYVPLYTISYHITPLYFVGYLYIYKYI